MKKEIEFKVPGEPQAKGSMRSFLTGWPSKKWSYVKRMARLTQLSNMILGWKHPDITTTSTNKNAGPWQDRIREVAEAKMSPFLSPWAGSIEVFVVFYMNRPANHYVSNKRGKALKEKFENDDCNKKPDIDKLLRCLLDAMSGVVYFDDAQNTDVVLKKRWGKNPGVWVRVREKDPAESNKVTMAQMELDLTDDFGRPSK